MSKLVPKLRFKEFSGEWEEKELGDIGKLVSGLTYSPDDVRDNGLLVLRSSNIQKSKITLDDTVYVRTDMKGVNLSQPNDILICVRNGSKALIGKNALIPKGMPLCTHGAFMTVFRSEISKFAYQLFQTNSYKKQVEADLGATINSINGNLLKKYIFYIPKDPKEQQKIANTLSSLDNLIEATSKKVEALKKHKKGLMQKLFPKEGKKEPELRFKEFSGEWEEKEVGELFQVTRGEVLSMSLVNDKASTDKPYPVYSSQTKRNGLAGYYSEYLFEDSITWTTDGANAGDVNYREGKFYCTNVCGVLINKNGYANHFIAELLNTVTKKHVSYVGNPKLMNGVMAKISIPIPQLEEQQKIANTLSSLDSLIEATSKKVEALKEHKKGLMQQMFVSGEE